MAAAILDGFFRGGIDPDREQTHPQIRLPKGVTERLEVSSVDGDSSRILESTFGVLNDCKHA